MEESFDLMEEALEERREMMDGRLVVDMSGLERVMLGHGRNDLIKVCVTNTSTDGCFSVSEE